MEPPIPPLATIAGPEDPSASQPLFADLYAELHRLAKRKLSGHAGEAGVGATTLLHEAYLSIADRPATSFPDRARFMGYASRVMRGIIIDHARDRRAIKRGGQFEITSLRTEIVENLADAAELSEISDALDTLAGADPALAELVDLKFFCGFSFADIAAMRGTSERTVQRHWEKARIYLHQALRRRSV